MSDTIYNMKSIIKLSDRKRGDTFPGIELQYLGDNNVPTDLTGYSIKIDFKRDITSNIAEFTFSTDDNSIILHDAPAGKFKLAPRLLNYQIGKYFFDIQLTSVEGFVKTLVDGELNILNDITR